jgi:hypothetical protein
MQLHILFRCDEYHTQQSFEFIGAFTNFHKMLVALQDLARGEDCELSDHDIELLGSIQQTQNYEGDGEFIYQIIQSNQII